MNASFFLSWMSPQTSKFIKVSPRTVGRPRGGARAPAAYGQRARVGHVSRRRLRWIRGHRRRAGDQSSLYLNGNVRHKKSFICASLSPQTFSVRASGFTVTAFKSYIHDVYSTVDAHFVISNILYTFYYVINPHCFYWLHFLFLFYFFYIKSLISLFFLALFFFLLFFIFILLSLICCWSL